LIHMQKRVNILSVLRVTAHQSIVDTLALYPPRAYLFAWGPRILTQIAFFAVLARFFGGVILLHYALIGNSFYMLASTLITGVAASITRERRLGTLPFLIASPCSPLLVLTGRNVGMALHGLISGCMGLVVAFALGMPFTPTLILSLLPLVLAVALSSYGAGLFLGSIALYSRGYHEVIANAFVLLILTICGVNYPVTTLPPLFQSLSWFLPLSRSLTAVHMLLQGIPFVQVLPVLGGEILVSLSYIILAQVLLRLFLTRARKAGTLEYH
jgi:ABC-2 type transport system permease protein